MKTYICGMPVRVEYDSGQDQTQIHLLRPVTGFLRDLVKGWLVHQGNVVVDASDSICVQGTLTDSTLRSRHL